MIEKNVNTQEEVVKLPNNNTVENDNDAVTEDNCNTISQPPVFEKEFCPKCGNEILNNTKFCSNCENDISLNVVATKPKGKKKKIIVISSIVIALSVVISLLLFFEDNNKSYDQLRDEGKYGKAIKVAPMHAIQFDIANESMIVSACAACVNELINPEEFKLNKVWYKPLGGKVIVDFSADEKNKGSLKTECWECYIEDGAWEIYKNSTGDEIESNIERYKMFPIFESEMLISKINKFHNDGILESIELEDETLDILDTVEDE